MSRLLLDTHVLLWWDMNDPRLAGAARAAIEAADQVFVSAASAWEAAIKTAAGKLRTSRSLATMAAEAHFLQMPVTFEHAGAVATLPPHHGDPFDRLIIATAKVEDLRIVTNDAKFASYDVPLVRAGLR